MLSLLLLYVQHAHIESDSSKSSLPISVWRTTEKAENATFNQSTLALLYPPGLLGGYRNQVLRFISFVVHAKTHNLPHLLLPSLLWSTQVGGIGYGVEWSTLPMDWVFDIEHWNSFSERLPTIISSEQLQDNGPIDCWETSPMDASAEHFLQSILGRTRALQSNCTLTPLQLASLRQGSLTPVQNISQAVLAGLLQVNPRKQDFSPQVEHCQNPVVYGGGIRSGRLWNDYVAYTKKGKRIPYQTDEWIYRALQPAPQWRQVADSCVKQNAANGKYVALHARIELEIMGHVCGREMVKNLTQIVQQVQGLLQDQHNEDVKGLFIAVSRSGMETNHSLYTKFHQFARDNIETLDRLTSGEGLTIGQSNKRQRIPVFECGEQILDSFYQQHPNIPDHGSLLQSVINFHIAVQADIFVGVKSSSYSTEVMTTRYHLGKGDGNYRYTLQGIEKVKGLPEPHSNCKRKKQNKP